MHQSDSVVRISLEGIIVQLNIENENIRITSHEQNIILVNQEINIVSEILRENFHLVYDRYSLRLDSKSTYNINRSGLSRVCIAFVLHYLYMYDMWRNTNRKQQDLSLMFRIEDLRNASTIDIIARFFKKNYPTNWEMICSLLSEMSLEDFRTWYSEREKYFDK